MSDQRPYVEFTGVDKRWNGQLGVADISLTINTGSFTALLGPSGCGKSTTLRLLAGLERPDRGKVVIDGKDVTGSAPSARNLSMVFQSYALFPHLSVAENVVFGLKVRRVPRAERIDKMNRALQITGLQGLERRKPAQLSGGQRQRVALARAIVAGQKLCLMDEPLSNLDAKLRHSVRKDIKKLQRDLGITVVYVTHDQSEAMSMADQIVLMNTGRIQQIGTPNELYSKPVNTFVAEFIGTPPMALIQSDAVTGIEDDLTLGLRAEHASIVAADTGRLRCQVADTEFLGAETLIALEHPAASGLCVLQPGLSSLSTGETIDLDFKDIHLQKFDRTGQNIEASNADL